MLLGFQTENELKAKAAMLVYVIYRSRDMKKGPQGLDMWAQIERFAKASAKRADGIDDFVDAFKRKMACGTINPYWLRNDVTAANAMITERGEIMTLGGEKSRAFGTEIFEDEKQGREIVDTIYNKTQNIILLVRDRLEREKPFEEMNNDGNEEDN